MINEGKVNIIMGGQWGSEGKGKLAGYLYHHHPEIDVAVCGFTPNAGHTFVDQKGKAHVSKVLPIGMLFESVKTVLIGPHAVFDVDRLLEEIQTFSHSGENATILIHPLACTLTAKNVADEAHQLNHIASTMQGSASAQVNKIMRDPSKCTFAKDNDRIKHMVDDTHTILQELLDAGSTVLIETAQGFDLGLNHGWKYPYVTGRDCLIGRDFDNAGANPKQLGSIIVALRTYPIRVGNTVGGFSGPHHDDQEEITWENLSKHIGRDVIERTTVTKRVRRVFTWSNLQVGRMCKMIQPDYAFLNFVNYFTEDEFDEQIKGIDSFLDAHDCKLKLLGHGAGLDEMEVLE